MKEANNTQDSKTQGTNKPRRRRRSRNNRSRSGQPHSANQQAPQNASKNTRGRSRTDKPSPKTNTSVQKKEVVTQKEVAELLLPSAASLHEFEFAVEGGAERLLEIAKKEQEHRHQWENYALKSQIKSQRLGLLFGFVLSLVALFLVKGFANAGQEELAKIVAIAVFGTIGFALLVSVFGSKEK